MPPRVSNSSLAVRSNRKSGKHSRASSAKSLPTATSGTSNRKKPSKRGLDGSELSEHRQKRHRLDLDSEVAHQGGLDHSSRDRPYKNAEDSDVDEGSDSEGNTWLMGQVDSEDDSDIDSDEAFGESDQEAFEGYIFRGSSSDKKKSHRTSRHTAIGDEDDIDLNEEQMQDEGDDDDDDESLGEDAVELVTMLDSFEEERRVKDAAEKKSSSRERHANAGSHESESEPEDHDSSSSDELEDAEEDEDGQSQLLKIQDLISSLDREEQTATPILRKADIHESVAPTESVSIQKISIEDLLPTISDPKMKHASKLLRDEATSSKRSGRTKKLEAPLPKRQQDRLDRAAANEQAKKTLERWVDTVKENRRAEHISFPLKGPDGADPDGQTRLMPVSKPTNALEGVIQTILHESGLVGTSGKTDDEQIRKYEELQTKKLPLEEVMRRRAELRKARELLFREEIRARRIKKIKSKAYRRVHRKEQEKAVQMERDMLIADDANLSEEERELHDRKRAEERMGAKHRESKWAKGMKQSGRTVWDDDARSGVTEMARRNEELRRRIEGKEIKDGDSWSEASSDDTESEYDEEADVNARGKSSIQRQISRLVSTNDEAVERTSGLASLPFMKRADAARKAQNEEDIARIQRDLDDSTDPTSEHDEDDPSASFSGRRTYGPATIATNVTDAQNKSINEFEEVDDSELEMQSDKAQRVEVDVKNMKKPAPRSSSNVKPLQHGAKGLESDHTEPVIGTNPWLSGSKRQEGKHGEEYTERKTPETDETFWLLDNKTKAKISRTAMTIKQKPPSPDNGVSKIATAPEISTEILSAPDTDGWVTVSYDTKDRDDSSDIDSSEDSHMPFVIRNQELVRRGFAGEDVVADFEQEKREIMQDEGDKVIDETLPGWGSWTGEGISKRQQKHSQGKVLKKQEGIKPEDRKDAKLERVIINEKRVKKNVKYLADSLPHQFESRLQYERSLRLPKGPEWQTKQTYQDGTKPRVLLKQGVILPPTKPLL
jgi:U3 small nucleolar RNA-associated protein 14